MKQFLRLQQYAGGRVKAILGEADRREGSTRHLDYTLPPTWTVGSARHVEKAAQEYRKTAKDRTGRKIRIDSPVLLAGVASIPIPMKQLPRVELKEDWYEIDTSDISFALSAEIHAIQAWLFAQWPEASIVWHFDESYPHCHFFATGNCKVLHPGVAATYDPVSGKRLKVGKKEASRQVMIDLQDRFHLEVGVRFGWARKSEHPRPRIASRQKYFTEKERLQRLAVQVAEWEARNRNHDDALDDDDQPAPTQ